jgi:hypothetical protein
MTFATALSLPGATSANLTDEEVEARKIRRKKTKKTSKKM